MTQSNQDYNADAIKVPVDWMRLENALVCISAIQMMGVVFTQLVYEVIDTRLMNLRVIVII